MAFRADEVARISLESADAYLIPKRHFADSEQAMMRGVLHDIVRELGPVIEAYPSWHPLVAASQAKRYSVVVPGNECGYEGLDHTRYIVNGFITCPYDDGQAVIDSVKKLKPGPVAHITAKRLDVKFYSPQATAILVKCEWSRGVGEGGIIPLSLAAPLMLEKELPEWREAVLAEPWKAMRDDILGRPHGARSSLFVNQETGQRLKKLWSALVETGMFGPEKVY